MPKLSKKIKLRKTERGFVRGEFVDRYGAGCSIQESSLASEACIWLGCDDPDPRVCIPGKGWQSVPLPMDTVCNTRMHLTQDMVKSLLPLLEKFAKTGQLR
jgi:hypothetical protein